MPRFCSEFRFKIFFQDLTAILNQLGFQTFANDAPKKDSCLNIHNSRCCCNSIAAITRSSVKIPQTRNSLISGDTHTRKSSSNLVSNFPTGRDENKSSAGVKHSSMAPESRKKEEKSHDLSKKTSHLFSQVLISRGT